MRRRHHPLIFSLWGCRFGAVVGPYSGGSERQLKAFVSSVMRDALNDARQLAVDVLDRAPGWCAARWQAPRLPRGEAVAPADDPAVGALPTDCLPDEGTPVVVLSSQMGAGKSLGPTLAALGVVLLVFH